MILRRQSGARLLVVWFSVLSVVEVVVRADDAFDCRLTVDSFKFDLTTLAGEHTVSRTRDSPPSSMVDTVRFDLCAELNQQSDVSEADQCPTGTRACLTKTNKKPDNPDRVVAVIPLSQTASLEPQSTVLSAPKGLSLLFHGASYPDSRTAVSTPQSFKLTLLCATETTDPKFLSYDGSQLQLEWSAPSGCGFQGNEPPENGGDGGDSDRNGGDGNQQKRVGSGIGWFFLVLLLAFASYFGLGAYYNYSTYGATGVDLIPHRDFWREVPYMLHDVISHLCSFARSRRPSSRGYVAV